MDGLTRVTAGYFKKMLSDDDRREAIGKVIWLWSPSRESNSTAQGTLVEIMGKTESGNVKILDCLTGKDRGIIVPGEIWWLVGDKNSSLNEIHNKISVEEFRIR